MPDPQLGSIDTPHGNVDFLQLVGLTSAEYEWLKADGSKARTEALMDKMHKDNPLLVTDLNRKHSYV